MYANPICQQPGSVRLSVLLNDLRVLCGPLRLCAEYWVLLLQYSILRSQVVDDDRVDLAVFGVLESAFG